MTDRKILRTIHGAGEQTCDGCGNVTYEPFGGAQCKEFGDILLRPGVSRVGHQRLRQCLVEGAAATRLAAIETAAREFERVWGTGAPMSVQGAAAHALREALGTEEVGGAG